MILTTRAVVVVVMLFDRSGRHIAQKQQNRMSPLHETVLTPARPGLSGRRGMRTRHYFDYQKEENHDDD